MATGPVSSDPSTTLEQVEKESVEKLKTAEESAVPLTEKEGKAKEEEIPIVVPVPLSESCEKTEEQESKPPTVEEVVCPGVEKKLNADEAPTLDVISPEPVEKEDKLIEPPTPEDIIESNDDPAVDIPSADNQEARIDHVTELDKSEVSGGMNDSIKDEAKAVTPDVEELKADESPSLNVVSPELVGKEDKLIEPPPPEDIIESNEVPAVDIPSADNQGPPVDHVTEIDKSEVSGVMNDSIKDEAKDVSPDVEELKADGSPSLNIVSPELVGKEDKLIEPPPPQDIPSTDIQELPNDHVTEVDKGTKGEAEVLPESKDLEKRQEESVEETAVVKPEEPEIKTEVPEPETKDLEAKEDQAEELPKETEPSDSATEVVAVEEVPVKELLEKTEIPESVIKTSEVKEQPEPLITKEPEVGEAGKVGTSAGNEEKKEDALVSAHVEESSEVKGEINDELKTEPIESETIEKIEVDAAKDKEEKGEITDAEPIKKTEVDAAKDEETLSDKVEGIQLKSDVEPIGIESLEQDNPTIGEAHVETTETEVPPTEFAEKIETEDPKEKKEETVETGNAFTDVKTETKQEDEMVNEELAVPEAKGMEEMASSAPKTQDIGKVSEAEQRSREIQLPVDTEAKQDEQLATKGSENDVEVEKKVDVEEPQKSETDTKTEAASQAVAPQIVQQEGVEDNAKPDGTIDEPIKDSEDTKTTEETPTEEAPVKQKNSNNLLSKMKQSLVKAKKAIIKKPQSKTSAT